MLDENDDDLFWGERPKQKFGQDKLFGHDTIHQDVKDEEGFKNPTKTSQIARGLFDSDDSSDESDIFAGNVKGLSKQPFLQGFKSSVPLFDDSPPDLDEKIKAERTTDKKPVGGVSIFGNTNIFAKQSISDVLENKRTQRSSNESTVEPSQNKSETLPKSEQSLNDKKLSTKPSLFDDDFEDDEVDFTVSKKKVDLFETGNKSTTTTSKKLNLFDDSVSEEDTDKTLRVVPKKVSLFNDSLSEEEVGIVKIPSIPTTAKPTAKTEAVIPKTNIFGEEVGENDSVASKNVSLFSDPSPEKEDSSKDRIPKASKKISLFDDDDDLFKDDIFSSLVPGSSGKGLFDDLDDADLFGVNSMEKESEAKLNSKSKKVSLFSDNEDEEDIFESKTVNTHSLLDEPKRAVSVFSEDELKIDKVETKLTSSRPDQEHHTEKKEEAKSLEKEREESGAENVSEKSEDKKREKNSGVDHEQMPRGGIKTKATKIKEMIEQRNSESTASKKSEKGDGDAKRGDSSKISSKRGSPLKIKPNLNINVSALLPGSLPPKLKTPGASESGDKEKSVLAEKKHIQTINTPTEKLPRDPISRSLPPPLPSSSEEYIEKPLSFDDKLEKVEVLHSVTKDRARIAVKRKPSTRKARQEAVRTSAIFLEDEDRDESSTNKDTSVVEKDVDKKSETEKDNGGKPLFIEDSKTSTNSKTETKTIKSTSLLLESDELGSEEADNTPKLTIKSSTKLKSEDDCSGSKKNETTIPSENEEISSKSSKDNIDRDKTKPLFDESAESEEEDFFKPTSKKPANTKTSLFDSGDGSDGNLFGSKTDKSGSEKKTEAQKPAKKKSLFDDSSSDDDLFAGGKSRNAVSGTSTKKSGRATKKNSSLKKLDTGKASEDPLSKLSD
nr:unnamed protein product [Callosobruchus chinensis]